MLARPTNPKRAASSMSGWAWLWTEWSRAGHRAWNRRLLEQVSLGASQQFPLG